MCISSVRLSSSLSKTSNSFKPSARTPQIYKNWAEKSCEGKLLDLISSLRASADTTLGLALLFFLLSLMGNLTYGLSILCHSMERDYIMTNLPWLIGSLGTIAEDVVIFVQFKLYNNSKHKDSAMV